MCYQTNYLMLVVFFINHLGFLQNLYTNIPMIKLLHVHVIHDTAKSLVPEPT